MQESSLALMIGNSRLHWAHFVDDTLQEAWNTNHLSAETQDPLSAISQLIAEKISPLKQILQQSETQTPIPLYLASVVPDQTKLWQTYPAAKIITLEHLPLLGLYPTLGIDRALAVLGAGETFGYPVLVIDAGTAMTFSGADIHKQLIGGAILPGLNLQLQSLAQKTAALPITKLPQKLPQRWAKDTLTAIESGIVYTVLAGIRDFITDWRRQFPDSKIALTGGDSEILNSYIQDQFPEIAPQIISDHNLIFWGIQSVKNLEKFL